MPLEQRKMVLPNVRDVEHEESPRIQPKVRPKRRWFSLGEKILLVAFTAILVLFASMILHTESNLNSLNREVQVLGSEITEMKKQNTELSNHVKEKSTYEVVWEKAKELGLNLNENNVKVVPGR